MDFLQAHPQAVVYYMHSKGVMSGAGSIKAMFTAMDWRHLMQYFNLVRFKECLSALDAGYNTCGINLRPLPKPKVWQNCYDEGREWLPNSSSCDLVVPMLYRYPRIIQAISGGQSASTSIAFPVLNLWTGVTGESRNRGSFCLSFGSIWCFG